MPTLSVVLHIWRLEIKVRIFSASTLSLEGKQTYKKSGRRANHPFSLPFSTKQAALQAPPVRDQLVMDPFHGITGERCTTRRPNLKIKENPGWITDAVTVTATPTPMSTDWNMLQIICLWTIRRLFASAIKRMVSRHFSLTFG
ncbi:hypothetical protein E2C01_027416 [Portunus trituberculatus]|uniref:Uncharacterized protein n=1 Tax=Portunus trituberculatus TaxID=210409 RepID=A0A5B7ENP5_PORTR|nr:hypothetical protein [Portunus trituberculatus]